MTQITNPNRRWHLLTPDRLIFGLLAAEGFLLLSEQFQWFALKMRGHTADRRRVAERGDGVGG